jgi:outer membrane protein assembly factor BamB
VSAISPPTAGKTGVLKWSFSPGYLLDSSSPALGADGTVYIAATNGDLYALTAPATGTTGVVRWVTHVEDEVDSSPSIGGDGTVYITSVDGRLSAF